MISTTIFPGRYTQGYDALNSLGEELKRFGQKGFAICDPFVYECLFPTLQKSLESAIAFQVEKFNGECGTRKSNAWRPKLAKRAVT